MILRLVLIFNYLSGYFKFSFIHGLKVGDIMIFEEVVFGISCLVLPYSLLCGNVDGIPLVTVLSFHACICKIIPFHYQPAITWSHCEEERGV